MANETVYAAGAVLWKVVDKELKVLVVHRTQHKDVSIPKGKVDPGETLPQTAVREIREETGLTVGLGPFLGVVDYVMPNNGKRKEVHYWTAEVDPTAAERSPFTSNNEIHALEWMTIPVAREKLSYSHDIDLINKFHAMHKAGNTHTFPIVIVRHGKAVPATTWDGPDSQRPLLHRGQDQARNIAGGLAAYAPTAIYTSTATRCIQTVTPLVTRTRIPVKESRKLSQENWTSGGDNARVVIDKRLAKQSAVVLCSHGPVIPQLVSELVRQTGGNVDAAVRRAASPGTADFSVFHIATKPNGPTIVAVENHEAP